MQLMSPPILRSIINVANIYEALKLHPLGQIKKPLEPYTYIRALGKLGND